MIGVLIAVTCWWLSGFIPMLICGYVVEEKITLGDLLSAMCCGLVGPIIGILAIGTIIEKYQGTVIVKKKKKSNDFRIR